MKKKWHTIPYIPDQKVFKAVMFALELKDKMDMGLAIHKAAKYYKVTQKDVAYWMGRIGGTKKAKNNIWGNYQKGKEDA